VKTLGIVISTPGRRSLSRTLQSILYQRTGVEDVLVVGDGYHAPTDELVQAFAELGLPVRYQATEKTRDWGHSQINYGLAHVRGDYVTYQDDDDIYMPRALEEMVRLVTSLDPPRPLLGRVKTPIHGLLWQRPGQAAVLDGHCLVAPNDKKRLGWMNSGYNGDQCLLHTTLRNYPELAWADRVWTLTRPKWQLYAIDYYPGPSTLQWRFVRPDGLAWSDAGIATLVMKKHDELDVYHARMISHAHLSTEEVAEVVQFAKWACQGNDCWFAFDDPEDPDMLAALRGNGFKEHTNTEYTLDWPPEPAGEFDCLVLENGGEKVMDWRDEVWGGRPYVEPSNAEGMDPRAVDGESATAV